MQICSITTASVHNAKNTNFSQSSFGYPKSNTHTSTSSVRLFGYSIDSLAIDVSNGFFLTKFCVTKISVWISLYVTTQLVILHLTFNRSGDFASASSIRVATRSTCPTLNKLWGRTSTAGMSSPFFFYRMRTCIKQQWPNLHSSTRKNWVSYLSSKKPSRWVREKNVWDLYQGVLEATCQLRFHTRLGTGFEFRCCIFIHEEQIWWFSAAQGNY